MPSTVLQNWTGLTYNFDFVGVNNYKILLTDTKFFKALGFTLILTIALIVGEIVIGIWVARALNTKSKVKRSLELGSFSQLFCQG